MMEGMTLQGMIFFVNYPILDGPVLLAPSYCIHIFIYDTLSDLLVCATTCCDFIYFCGY